MENNLKLNEALLLVNKINISSPIEVYHQLEECFGCPLDKLTPRPSLNESAIDAQYAEFIVGTQHNFHLELRQLDSDARNSTRDWCRLNDLSLNSYGRFRIDVSHEEPSVGSNISTGQQHGSLRCVLNTIDSGECSLCPFAILVCILFAIVGCEQIYERFWLARPKQKDRAVDGKKVAVDSNEQHLENEVAQDNLDQAGVSKRRPPTSDLDNGTEAPRRTSNADQIAEATISAATAATSTAATTDNPPADRPKRNRIESLDIFRGLTLAGMIFVNYGGAGYAILEHKAWDGITLADFVFPFFIFSMGASVAITTRSMVRRQEAFRSISWKIFKRALILALMGICLNSKWVNYNQSDGLRRLRLTGVLQRFSISYLVVAFTYAIALTISGWIRAQSLSNVPYLRRLVGVSFELLTAINCGAVYVYLTFYFDFDPNCPTGYIGPGGQTDGGQHANCTGGSAAWIDRLLLSADHMYNDHEVKEIFKTQVSHDPEGILGYSTSILLTLIGLQCGKILISHGTHKQKIVSISLWAIVMLLASSLIVIVPINKRLWSITFVTVTALAAFVTIMLLYILVDIYSIKRPIFLRLLSSAGKNSIFLYIGHSLIFEMLPWWYPIDQQQATHLQLLLRLSWSTTVWLLIAHYMASKRIFIKV
jgi:heparan-alpha-glucosaminide N-acetyltransferase